MIDNLLEKMGCLSIICTMKQPKKVTIYTDGACSGNPGKGAYAAIILYKDRRKIIKGACSRTTNNKMELTAAIKALESLTEPCEVMLYTDSAYLVGGMTGWIAAWKKNGWKTAGKKSVKNRELWERLSLLNKRHNIRWIKVAGHSGNELNELCDKLAKEQIGLIE